MFLLNTVIVGISVFLAIFSISIDSRMNLPGFYTPAIGTIGWLVFVIGLVFRLTSSLQFYKNKISILTLKAQSSLIKNGLFSFSRNPLYIGILLIFLGCILLVGTVSGLGMWGLSFILCDYWVRNKEETYIGKAFGAEYDDYKKQVPRWIVF